MRFLIKIVLKIGCVAFHQYGMSHASCKQLNNTSKLYFRTYLNQSAYLTSSAKRKWKRALHHQLDFLGKLSQGFQGRHGLSQARINR